jgi:uracil-DNA glycosylase
MFSVKDYKNIESWTETYPDHKVTLSFENQVHSSWFSFFADIIQSVNLVDIEKKLSDELKKNKFIMPYPKLLLSSCKYTFYNDVKVVFVGQDPYFKRENGIPQSTGLAFSVPVGINIPSSLENIFKNMIKYGHLTDFPDHGNLQFLAAQGCLFLNTALTVAEGEKNSHSGIWNSFTDAMIVKLSNEKKNIVFVLWGGPAFSKFNLIDKKNHEIVISSHPSGLSCNTPLKKYPAFANNDHFGQINKYLKEHGKTEIIYGL